MKKILFALVAFVAIAMGMTSCSFNHEKCNIYFVNEYSKNAMILVALDSSEDTPANAELYAELKPGQTLRKGGFKLTSSHHAIFYVEDETQSTADKIAFKRVGSFPLADHVGCATLILTVTSNGLYSVTAESL